MPAESDQTVLITPALGWLLAGIGLAVVPHTIDLPAWVSTLALAMLVWRFAAVFRHRPVELSPSFLSQATRTIFVLACFLGVYLHHGTLAGRDPGTSLLVLLTGFKVLEIRHERDFFIAAFLGYFLVITRFFYTQSIATAAGMIPAVLVITASLIMISDRGRGLSVPAALRFSAKLLLQASPFMLILFVLFPRINGPLWGLPKDAHAGLAGIDDVMEPGSISRLIQSDDVAFRVEFEGRVPEQSQLYWRGPVLWFTDGRAWIRDDTARPAAPLRVRGDGVRYAVTLEPSNQRWLFALEMPASAPRQSHVTHDLQFLSWTPVRQRQRYELTSYPDYYLDRSSMADLRRALQLPPYLHKRSVALGRSWRAEESEPLAIIERALRLFNEADFYYTLSPPLTRTDTVDDFLFKTRKGFCEHYAAAFVILMRAAGIPARVVTGYQGGNYNPVGDYFIVYQRDAHAWAEVWLDGRGWVRVDPTSAVSPARIQQGIEGALPEAIRDIPFVFNRSLWSRDAWQQLRHTWDAVNNQWNQWVISYGPQRQMQLLGELGLYSVDLKLLALLSVVAGGGVFALLTAWLVRERRPHPDPARALYDRFCGKLARRGLGRRPSEGPLAYARRVTGRRRDLAGEVNDITGLYVAARYGSQRDLLVELASRIRAFRPPAAPPQAPA